MIFYNAQLNKKNHSKELRKRDGWPLPKAPYSHTGSCFSRLPHAELTFFTRIN